MQENTPYKVCILTAGQGKRMLPLTSSINKSLLPLGEKAIISHIIDQFPDDVTFVIATGYRSDTVRGYIELAHKSTKVEFVDVNYWEGPGSGPGYSLLACEEKLQCPFFFVSCDTIFSGSASVEDFNWVGVAKTDNPRAFCTVRSVSDEITGFIDKKDDGTDLAFIGLAFINDHREFFDGLRSADTLVEGELQITSGLERLIMSRKTLLKEFSWQDCGSVQGYQRAILSRQGSQFDFSKPDEHIYFSENKVIKFFANQKVATDRYKRSLVLDGFVPSVTLSEGGFYGYDFLDGNVFYDCNVEHLSDSLFKWLINDFWKDTLLDPDESEEFKQRCHHFYFDKTQHRLNMFERNHKDPAFFSANIFGCSVPSASELLGMVNWEYLSNGIPSRFHGDLQFDNIIYNEDLGFKLIDWRQDFSGSLEVGDRYYDMAKLLGGMLVPYKQIKAGNFHLQYSDGDIVYQIDGSDNFHEVIKKYINALTGIGIDSNKVHIITAIIFLNMAPLHTYPFSDLLYTIGRQKLYDCLSKSVQNSS